MFFFQVVAWRQQYPPTDEVTFSTSFKQTFNFYFVNSPLLGTQECNSFLIHISLPDIGLIEICKSCSENIQIRGKDSQVLIFIILHFKLGNFLIENVCAVLILI